MTYLQAHKKPLSLTSKSTIGACVIVLLIGVIIQITRPSFFLAVFSSLARPFWRMQLAIQLGSLKTPEGLLQENVFLQRELDEANVRLQSVALLENENAELKSLMGHASTTLYILAAVLKHPPSTGYDELVIDAGTDANFENGDNVFAPGDVLIGRVSDVLSQTSKVTLLSSPGEKYEVLVGESNVPATAVGRGGGQYQVELPRDIKVNEGDFVIAPTFGSKPFGIVISVISDPAMPFETVLFAPPVNIYQLRWVLVDTKDRN